jgi:hypothetical protein
VKRERLIQIVLAIVGLVNVFVSGKPASVESCIERLSTPLLHAMRQFNIFFPAEAFTNAVHLAAKPPIRKAG